MPWVKKLIWLLSGLLLVFFQSFFISRWLTVIWVILLCWADSNPWWLIFVVGLFEGLILVEPLGRAILFYFFLALLVSWLKRFFGLGRDIKVKVNSFH